jgi:hypothetical protein
MKCGEGFSEWCQPQTPSGNLDDLDDLMFLIIWEYKIITLEKKPNFGHLW